MQRLRLGKLPIGVLTSAVLSMGGAPSDLLATGPKAGLDFGAVKLERGYLLVSADPVTGVSEEIGRYAVHVSANDVATSGTRPSFIESVILLPERTTVKEVSRISREIDAVCRELGISVVGGHTEVTPGLARPIVVVTAFGMAERYVSSAGARAGNTIMMTKTAGIEGTAALARSVGALRKKLSSRALLAARAMLSQVSVVDEAERAYKTGGVSAMHDCTEGGVLGAAFEMSHASGVGFELDEGAVPVAPETLDVCRAMSLDPLKLIGSGSLLIAVEGGREDEVVAALTQASRVTAVGRFTKSGRVLVRKDGRREKVNEAPEDELWRAVPRFL